MDLALRSGYINEINACLAQSMITTVAATAVAGAGLLIGGHAVGGPVWAYLSAGALVTGAHMGARNALMMRNIRQRYEEERGTRTDRKSGRGK